MAGLSPQQLQIISQEYYINGFVLGRDKLYEHLKVNMNPMLNAVNQDVKSGLACMLLE